MQNSNSGLYARRVLSYTVLIIIALLSLFPFIILAINASRTHTEILSGFTMFPGSQFGKNFLKMLREPTYPILYAMRNSLIVAASAAGLTVYFSAMTAYGIHVYNFKFKKASYIFILAVLMIPAQVSSVGFLKEVFAFGWDGTYLPLIIPAIAAPNTVFFMRSYISSSLPLEIVEAARIDGASEFRTFNTLILPIMKPAMAVQAIFAFVATWNNYFMPAMVLASQADQKKKTLPIMIASLRSANWTTQDQGLIYMLIFAAIIPLILVYLLLSKFIIRGIALGSVKG